LLPSQKSKSSGMADRGQRQVPVRVWRRLLLGDYRAYKRRWEANNTPQAQREYIWVDRCGEITRRMNQKGHHTLLKGGVPDRRYTTSRRSVVRPAFVCNASVNTQRQKYVNTAAVDKPQEGQTGTAVRRAPVGQGPSGPNWLATALGFWSGRALAGTAWAGLCLIHHHHKPAPRC
jgi:hypothetical protein